MMTGICMKGFVSHFWEEEEEEGEEERRRRRGKG